jgi:transposase
MAIFIQNRQELEQRLVIMKTQEGWSIRALARHFTISRNMVRRILRKHEKRRDQGHDILLTDRLVQKRERASKLDSYQETLQLLLEKYPRITGQRLFEELRDAGYDGGISILRDRLRRLRPTPKKTPVNPNIDGVYPHKSQNRQLSTRSNYKNSMGSFMISGGT